MVPRVFGVETEYGFVVGSADGAQMVTPEIAARHLFNQMGMPSGVPSTFLPNGGRAYMDTGFHPEYATAECRTPHEAVVHRIVGDRYFEAYGAQLEAKPAKAFEDWGVAGRPKIWMLRNNTDGRNSYGCHENYLGRRDLSMAAYAEGLNAFLVTRQIFAGTGAIIGGQYRISQRADFIDQDMGNTTVAGRPVLNTRDEPHADGERFRRLHIIVGDSNMSEFATWLTLGTTACVLDLIEAGQAPHLELKDTAKAIRTVSRDLSLGKRWKLTMLAGPAGSMTALEIQWCYFRACARLLAGDPEAAPILRAWQDTLRRLQEDPASLDRTVDWVIKMRLLDRAIRKGATLGDARTRMLDIQYHDLRPGRGLFLQMQARGLVDRRVTEDEIARATTTPPETRAKVRGLVLREGARRGWDVRVDWGYVSRSLQVAHLEDPLAAEIPPAVQGWLAEPP